MKLLELLLILWIQKTVNAEAIAVGDADANPDADGTARSGHIGKTFQNVASNIAHLFDRNRNRKPKRKPSQPTATEIRFVAVRVPVQDFNQGPAYGPPSTFNSAYRPPSQPNSAYGPPSVYAPPSQPSTAYRPPSGSQRRPSYSPVTPNSKPSYKPTYNKPNTLRPPRIFLTTTRRPTTWIQTTKRTTTWRPTTWTRTTKRSTTWRTTSLRTTTSRPTTRRTTTKRPQPPLPTLSPRPPQPTLPQRPPTLPPESEEDFGRQGGRSRQERFRFQQQLGPIETERSGFPSDQQDALPADPNTEESERAFLPIEVLLGVVAGLLTILLLLLAAVLIVLYRRQRRQQVPVKKSVKKEEVVLKGIPSFPGPKPPPKPPKPLPRDPDPLQRRLPPPPPTWHPPVIYALPGPADPWSQRNTHQAEVHRSALGQEELQVHSKIQARPEAQLQREMQNHQMNFQQKPVRYMQEASQQSNALKRPPEAGWREASPPRQPQGVPRQPPPASLEEIQNNQIFRQRSEGRDNPNLPPKPSMPQRGSKISSLNLAKRKISDSTDIEVWGSDFQEVVEHSGRVVALYSYNGEEPGTLQVQPGQQFRLLEDDQGGWIKVRRLLATGAEGKEEGYIPVSYVRAIPV